MKVDRCSAIRQNLMIMIIILSLIAMENHSKTIMICELIFFLFAGDKLHFYIMIIIKSFPHFCTGIKVYHHSLNDNNDCFKMFFFYCRSLIVDGLCFVACFNHFQGEFHYPQCAGTTDSRELSARFDKKASNNNQIMDVKCVLLLELDPVYEIRIFMMIPYNLA